MKKKRLASLLAIFAILIAVLILFSDILLGAVSNALVHQDPLQPSEAIVVLAGSSSGNRMKAAAELYHKKFGKKIIFSGFEVYPGTHTSDLMKTYALNLGVKESDIISRTTDEEVSTRGESRANLKLMQENGIKKFILVTSAYHTRRSTLIYKKSIEEMNVPVNFITYGAKDSQVPVSNWWKVRTGQKEIFYEYIKLLTHYLN